MSDHDALRRRSHTCRLLGHLYRDGLTPPLVHALQKEPALAEALPAPFDEDERAADYQHLFGFNVFPYAGVFLDPAGLLNGPVADRVRQYFLRAGCPLPMSGESLDHLGHELAWLAHMMQAEAEALQDGIPAEVRRVRRIQRRFLDEHLLGWLPAFVRAVEEHPFPFFQHLARQTLHLVLEHRRALAGAVAGSLHLPEPPPLLDDPATGLHDIAGYLATPPWSGLFLSRDAIGTLARALDLPRGFGDRRRMLANLLQTAAAYDRLTDLTGLLTEHLAAWKTHFTTLHEPDLPALTAACQRWTERLDTTARLLERLAEAAPPGAPTS
ncbi:MAG: hypothetical protein D6746_01425 [Bacteroidetes bacterium]|nr:MAG: hypothetical protein D6746_01425 [Bacteroidota bacterium]